MRQVSAAIEIGTSKVVCTIAESGAYEGFNLLGASTHFYAFFTFRTHFFEILPVIYHILPHYTLKPAKMLYGKANPGGVKAPVSILPTQNE